MILDAEDYKSVLEKTANALNKLRDVIVDHTATVVVNTAAMIAPDEDDFREAVHVEGSDGDHALIVAEERIAQFMRREPRAINAMRQSIEWDERIRKDDAGRAAYAAVNESLEKAEKLWPERPRPAPGPR